MVHGIKPKQIMHSSSKLMRRKPQGHGQFERYLSAADWKLLAVPSKPGRSLSTEQVRKLEQLKRKEANHDKA